MNPWISNNFIDSCAFDPKYSPEDDSSREIFRLYADEQLGLMIAHSNLKEIEHPNTPDWVKAEARSRIYTIETERTSNEIALLNAIHALITGNGKPEQMRADAEHLYEATKYGSYFVTTDKRLLRHSTELLALCGINVVLPSEFLAVVQKVTDKATAE